MENNLQTPSKWTLFLNSTIAMIGAFTLTTLVHECGHFLSYLAFGGHPVLYFNKVDANDNLISLTGVVVSVLAGPFISLIQGIGSAIWVGFRKNDRPFDLFIQWASLFGLINFFGYLMLTPLSTAGDTGKVATLIHSPQWVNVLIAVLGVAVLMFLLARLDKRFSGFLFGESDSRDRARWIRILVFFPIIVGSIVNVIFAFPIPVAISAIYPATSSFSVLIGFGVMQRLSIPEKSVTPVATAFSWGLLATMVGLLVINRLLVGGVGG